jgi:hypothetical protein
MSLYYAGVNKKEVTPLLRELAGHPENRCWEPKTPPKHPLAGEIRGVLLKTNLRTFGVMRKSQETTAK